MSKLTFIRWTSKPHFYKSGNVIVEYIVENAKVISDLNRIMGKPFAPPP